MSFDTLITQLKSSDNRFHSTFTDIINGKINGSALDARAEELIGMMRSATTSLEQLMPVPEHSPGSDAAWAIVDSLLDQHAAGDPHVHYCARHFADEAHGALKRRDLPYTLRHPHTVFMLWYLHNLYSPTAGPAKIGANPGMTLMSPLLPEEEKIAAGPGAQQAIEKQSVFVKALLDSLADSDGESDVRRIRACEWVLYNFIAGQLVSVLCKEQRARDHSALLDSVIRLLEVSRPLWARVELHSDVPAATGADS